MEEKIRNAVENAMLAFWDKIAEAFPEIKTGDFPPDAHFAFDEACVKAATIWVEGNLPGNVAAEPVQCKKCGGKVLHDYCQDEACPYSDWPQHIPLIELNSMARENLEARHGVVKRLRVTAKAHSDDHLYSVEFDAAPWFEQARLGQIMELHGIEWKGDYAADAVAEFFESTNPDIAELLEYTRRTQGTSHACGFECSVDADEAMAWLKEHRDDVWAVLLCIDKGVSITDIKDGKLKGWWEWSADSEESDSSFRTISNAALDAVEVLGLA